MEGSGRRQRASEAIKGDGRRERWRSDGTILSSDWSDQPQGIWQSEKVVTSIFLPFIS